MGVSLTLFGLLATFVIIFGVSIVFTAAGLMCGAYREIDDLKYLKEEEEIDPGYNRED